MPTPKAPIKKKPVAKKPVLKKVAPKKVAVHKPVVKPASPHASRGGKAVHVAEPAAVEQQLAPREKYEAAVGKRKSAIARVRYYPLGSGEIVINGLTVDKYFGFKPWADQSTYPLTLTGWTKGRWSVKATGGGKHGQAHAMAHGITRVLLLLDSGLRPALKADGLLTRDARVKERKKPGLKRARRAPQWQKR